MAYGHYKWTKIDEPSCLNQLGAEDSCFAYYDYNGQDDWYDNNARRKTGHQIIKNYKRKPSELATNPQFVKYKHEAINEFANLLVAFMQNLSVLIGTQQIPFFQSEAKTALVPVPSSRMTTDPDFDNRVTATCNHVSSQTGIPVVEAIVLTKPRPSLQASGDRNIEHWKSFHGVNPLVTIRDEFDYLFIVDDVFTEGCTYMAMKEMLNSLFPKADAYGFFFARAN